MPIHLVQTDFYVLRTLESTFLINNNETRLNSTKYSVEDYDKFSLKILDSEFWKYLPRPNILIRETDGYDDEIPIIFKDNYAKNNILDIKDITINGMHENILFILMNICIYEN